MSSKTNRITKRSARKSKVPKSTPSTSTTTTPSNQDPNGPIYFWRPQETTTGYLSQWYAQQPFRDRHDSDKIYPTAEHYMMHHKAQLFGDAEIAATILEAVSPRDVKELGRAVRGFDNAVWERERERIVTEGNWCKFTLPVLEDSSLDSVDNIDTIDGEEAEGAERREEGKGKEGGGGKRGEVVWKLGNSDNAETMRASSFREVLLATGTRELVEASPYDRIWGVGFAAKGAERNRRKWGLNLLGKCLMEVREQFRREAEENRQADGEKP